LVLEKRSFGLFLIYLVRGSYGLWSGIYRCMQGYWRDMVAFAFEEAASIYKKMCSAENIAHQNPS
jgi:hypothetical protein